MAVFPSEVVEAKRELFRDRMDSLSRTPPNLIGEAVIGLMISGMFVAGVAVGSLKVHLRHEATPPDSFN